MLVLDVASLDVRVLGGLHVTLDGGSLDVGLQHSVSGDDAAGGQVVSHDDGVLLVDNGVSLMDHLLLLMDNGLLNHH